MANKRIYLQQMVEAIRDDDLPANWQGMDLETFSGEKRLWDYQQKALKNALKLLWKYYGDFGDFRPGEDLSINAERKRKLWQWYRDNGLPDILDIGLTGLLREYYPVTDGKIAYEHFINRACFWMATGSGKTLVIVKLIELLWHLMRWGEIPENRILVLTHRDDLLEQLKRHVEEFNRPLPIKSCRRCGHQFTDAERCPRCGSPDIASKNRRVRIILRELRDYASARREGPLFPEQEVTVFYYRSDNLSDEQKEKIVDFRNYDNDGRWYVLLDEAHKGDKEESKRQHIYAILSRNGFLFNFSATFTDPRDIVTTLFNFNLSEYIKEGYGKRICILKQEMRAFRDEEDYNGDEKQKVVLKALLMLAYARKVYENRQDKSAYHKPLMLVLVNSVNTEDADLLLFFRELERIGKGEIYELARAKDELLKELQERPPFVFEEERAEIDESLLNNLTPEDLLRLVFNAESPGEIEVLVRPSDRKEMAFKLKTTDRPFALIKIGDISGWIKEKLKGYEINERFDDEGYFARLNEDDSDITILMGSRTFYEGWDSNRPNVICYINIGVGEDARKFILQSIGRGVRIEPIKGERKRLQFLYNAGLVDRDRFRALEPAAKALETLFVFGTKREALKTVVEGLEQEHMRTGERRLTLFEVNPEARDKLLLVPVYQRAGTPLAARRELSKFPIEKGGLDLLRRFVESTDDRVLLMLGNGNLEPHSLRLLKSSFSERERFYRPDGQRYGDVVHLMQSVGKYLAIQPEEVERLKPLEDEIRHFRQIIVTLEDLRELEEKMQRVKSFKDPVIFKQELKRRLEAREITFDECFEAIIQSAPMHRKETYSYGGSSITIRHIAQHYYLPVVVAESDRVDFIRHIIKTQSERQFIEKLEEYLSGGDNGFQHFDWWMFSKIDENLDDVYIPYYDPNANRIARFKPDFIFWLQKGSDYFIVFVDPKGTEYRDADRKLEGYRMVFEEEGRPKEFNHNEIKVRVLCFLWTTDRARIPDNLKQYWIDDVSNLVNRVVAHLGGRSGKT